MTDSLKARCAAGTTALGAWCVIPSALTAEGVARAGFDWVCIDMQHGAMDYATACEMIRAVDLAAVTPIVRAPWNEPGLIGRMLDAGALGIIVPMIQTVDDARRAVDACLYPPAGRRSFGPLRAGLRDGPGYFAGANARVLVVPMIETAEALAAVDEILAVPGVDGAFVGPMDLSVARGRAPGDNDGVAVFDDALARILAACRSAAKVPAVFSNVRVAPRRLAQGFRMVSIGVDFGALAAGIKHDLESVRAIVVKGGQ